MSSRQGIYISMGVMIMVILGMVMNFYTTSKANETISEVQRLILEGREIGNKRGNQTLGAVGEAIQEIKTIEGELRDNLTTHRIVTNDTNSQIKELIANFNETNEEERVKAVDKILEGIENNTLLLERLLDN